MSATGVVPSVAPVRRAGLGRAFGWLWGAFAISSLGTWLAFDALPLIAILRLHVGPAAVSLLAASGVAVSAVVAIPLGPWVEFRAKRSVLIGADLIRCLVLLSVPISYALGWLRFGQLVVVAVVVGAADLAFTSASGAYLKTLVRPTDLLRASARFESTTWTASVLGPPLGGAAIGVLGPVVTVLANAVSFLLSALGIRAIRDRESVPIRLSEHRLRPGELLAGWRFILGQVELRALFVNTVLVNGLIMACAPLLAVLMLGRLGFAPWQYGLAFSVPCLGGLIGSRLSGRLVARFGADRILRVTGVLRACWPIGLVFIGPGAAGLALVMVVEFGLILSIGVFNPVYATRRLERTGSDRVARTLLAWSASSKATIAVLTALWGVLAGLTGARVAIGLAGLLLLVTPLTLPRYGRPADQESIEQRS